MSILNKFFKKEPSIEEKESFDSRNFLKFIKDSGGAIILKDFLENKVKKTTKGELNKIELRNVSLSLCDLINNNLIEINPMSSLEVRLTNRGKNFVMDTYERDFLEIKQLRKNVKDLEGMTEQRKAEIEKAEEEFKEKFGMKKFEELKEKYDAK